MPGILQSYEIIEPVPRVQPFAHYKGKADMSGLSIQPDRLLRLSFIDVQTAVANSDAETLLLTMLQNERTFLPANDTLDMPIAVAITKSPKSPLSWEATYLHPFNDPYDYIISTLQVNQESMAFDPYGVLSWSLQASMEYAPFSGNGVFEGYSTKEIQISISATTDFRITDFDTVDGIITQGLNISPNIHTLQYSERLTEDTSLKKVYQYTWQFGVL